MSPPLDEQYVVWENPQSGKSEKIPALHPRWKQSVQFVLYQPPPLDLSDTASYEEWTERCTFLEDDLHWLLRQAHDKFWCQVIFDETLQRCIDSYLHHAPRSYDVYLELPTDAKTKHQTLHRLFFMTCLRMATYKESKDCHITPSVFGEILYENFIFDIPKVMDICVLFGLGNPPIVTKMVENIFDQQPKYVDDLRAVVPTILEVFDNIQKKCGLRVETSFSPQKLTDGNGSRNLLTLPLSELQDLVLYLADTCATLSAFLDLYPKAAGIFGEQDFPIRLVMMYESLVPALTEAFLARDWGLSTLRPLLTRRLRQAQRHLLLVFRQVVFTTLLQPAMDNRNPDEVEHAVESYVHLMTTILSERRFTAHYDHLFPFVEDQDLLSQTSYSIDETRILFLEQGFSEARAAHGNRQPKKKKKSTPDNSPRSQAQGGAAASAAYGGSKDGDQALAGAAYEAPDYGEDYGACAPRVSGIQLESLITSVKDLLPYLGEGFIELCLEEFGYDVEKVINGVLEEKLPASLATIDRALPRQSKPATEEDVLSERANVYDNDEFDVFNRTDVDMSRIHKGKKEKGLDMSILDHKEELSTVRPLFERYGHEDVPSMYDKYEYDDEYDDTYDDNNVGADDAGSADELRERRPFTVPRILAGGPSRRVEVEDEDSDEDGDAKPRDHFIEDPAKIRERQAQRRAAKQNHTAKRPPGQQPTGTGRFDVKGKPKGEGQDSGVLRNRAFKEKNKASRVHHNRKNLSDKKRKI